ncbi:MAG: NfeD family protein [Pseudomonadota bacterium]
MDNALLIILAILRDLGPYTWFIVGALFLIAEVVLPGINLIWFGAAASAVGAMLLAFPGLGWEVQMVAFIVCSGLSVAAARVIANRVTAEADDVVNRGPAALIGRQLALAEPIVNGTGRATFADSSWRVTGPDQPAGTLVKVVGIDASTLVVEPVQRG